VKPTTPYDNGEKKSASIIASATEPSLRPPNMGNSIPRGLATK